MKNAFFSKSGLAAAVACALAGHAQAAEFTLNDGQIYGRFDTLLSAGALFRTEGQNKMLAATDDVLAMAARGYSTQLNKNDANNNFDPGLASMVYKITPSMVLNFGDSWGIVASATGFYDSVIMDGGHDGGVLNAQVPPVPVPGPGGTYNRYATYSDYANNGTGDRFSDAAKSEVGRRFRLLDAYIFADVDVLDRPMNLRLGQQVINWGEALFVQNGVNTANYIDLAALRLPGSEIKEALLPLQSFYFNWGVTDNLSLEGFYQFDWENSQDAPAGTYYSTHDAFPSKGAARVVVDGRLVQASAFPTLGYVPIGDVFAAYTEATYGAISDPTGYAYEATQVTLKRVADDQPDDSGQFGLAFRYFSDFFGGTEFGAFFSRTHARLPVVGAQLADLTPYLGAPAGVSAIPEIIDNTTYHMVYPEDVDMVGFTFSTNVGPVSLSGEIAYRHEQPIINEVGDNLITNLAASAVPVALTGVAPTVGDLTMHCVRDKIGGKCLDSNTVVANQPYYFYDLARTTTASLVGIYNLGPRLGADNVLTLLEVGIDNTSGLAKRDQNGNKLYYNSTGAISASEAAIQTPGNVYKTYLTENAWGYRLVVQSEYNDVFAGVTLRPSLRFSHDVDGYSPIGGNFLEGRRAGTIGVDFVYLNNFEVGIQATAFWGNDYSNKLSDRDNASLALKYAF